MLGAQNHEKTASLFGSVESRQKSRKAEYARKYLADPQNNARINENRRKNRQRKKEEELNGDLYCLFDREDHTVESTDPQGYEAIKSLPNRNFFRHHKGDVYLGISRREINNSHIREDISTDFCKKENDFLSSFFDQLGCLDGRAFARNFPATIALGFLTFHACKFVVEQTAPIYESLSFPNPEVASLGALALAVGFAGFSALSRSGVAKLFMGIMVCYELMLVYTGTKVNQNDISSEALRSNPAYVHALEYHELAKKDYALKKARFEDQNSQVYHNSWYKLKHLDPAFEKFSAATQNLIQLESDLKSKEENIDFQLWLKVLFRLSALVLCMLLAKELLYKGARAFRFSYYFH